MDMYALNLVSLVGLLSVCVFRQSSRNPGYNRYGHVHLITLVNPLSTRLPYGIPLYTIKYITLHIVIQ